MMEIVFITSFLGWCTLVNFALLLLTTILLFLLNDFIGEIHSRMTGIEPEKLKTLYFQYLAHYKILIIVFNLVPYIVLKIIG